MRTPTARSIRPIFQGVWRTPASLLLAASLIAPASAGSASSTMPDTRDDVQRTVLLPPGPGNPRNSEGDFLRLNDGRVLFVYTHFTGGGGDDDAAHLAARTSPDGGRTWTDRDEVVLHNEGGMNVMSVTLRRLPRGEIGLFYLRKNSPTDCRPVLRRSSDEGKTWGPAKEIITDESGYYVLNNDRVAQLRSGRLVVPVALHKGPDGAFISRGVAMCYISDDFGRTWRRSRTVLSLTTSPSSIIGLQEPGVVPLKDGRLMMFCRTDQGFQYASFSEDGGETWGPAEPTTIRSPASPASIERIPATGDLLLVWNDNFDPAMPGNAGYRTPLNVAISRDEGKTWTHRKTLMNDPNGWYCYTAIDFVDGRVLLAHCAGDRRANGLGTTQITAFSTELLYR